MATATVTALIDSDEFFRLYDSEADEFANYELFHGEVIERPMANFRHDLIKNVIGKCLDSYLRDNRRFIALVEVTFRVGPSIVFLPDLAVISRERAHGVDGKYITGSPDIAFEVISSDSADRLKYKTDTYLEFGSKAVCCIYPNQRRIMVFTQTAIREFRDSDSLELPEILPGFTMPLTAVFDPLAD